MLSRLFSRLHPIHRATTSEEREAIGRFHYSLLDERAARTLAGVDHARKTVRDEADAAPGTTLLYAGSPDEVTAALRVRSFAAGQVPPALSERYSLELIPSVQRLAVAEFGPLLTRPSLGARVLLPSLAAAGWQLVGENGTDLIVLSCRPGLVSHYQALGARLFGGRLISGERLEVPMLAIPSDDAHLRRVGSPAAGFADQWFGDGKRAPLDIPALAPLLVAAERSVVTDPSAVSNELQKALLGGRRPPVFLQSLDAASVRRLASQGFILGVPTGAVVTREGREERELFAVLDGTFEVSIGGVPVNQLGRGDLFGEVAFFASSGRRSATVRALGPGRLVVIRKRFLDELARRDPRAAMAIVQNLARILAERLERLTPAR